MANGNVKVREHSPREVGIEHEGARQDTEEENRGGSDDSHRKFGSLISFRTAQTGEGKGHAGGGDQASENPCNRIPGGAMQRPASNVAHKTQTGEEKHYEPQCARADAPQGP
jgi:hypothetical protein